MTRYDERNMRGESVISDRCVFCGRPSGEQHHVVYRSRGGAKGPTLAVCGWGNASGCHGLLHAGMLHVRWNGRWWECLRTGEPVSVDRAWSMGGWVELRKPAALATFGRRA